MLLRALAAPAAAQGVLGPWVASACGGAAASWGASAPHESSSTQQRRSYHVAHLGSRGVISVQGEECVSFLQGMTTNDLRPLEQPGAGPVYSVLLTAKGKYLHDLFAYSLPGSAGDTGSTQELLLDVSAAGIPSALAWLSRYRLRRKLQLADASGRHAVWAAFDGQLHADSTGAGAWCQDPRLPELGLRGVFDAQQLPPPPAGVGGSSSRKQRAAGMSIADESVFRAWRYSLGVAEGDGDMPSGEVAPLECNLDALSGISYNKGCYIGQERNSYTHYRGIIRRRFVPVQLPGLDEAARLPCPIPIALESATAPGAAGRAAVVGTLTGQVGQAGIACLKLAPALAAAEGRGPQLQLQLEGAPQLVVPQRPCWWPADWGREEERPAANPP